MSETKTAKRLKYICVADGGACRFYDDIHHRVGVHL